jgi:site-specific recombinase XerD
VLFCCFIEDSKGVKIMIESQHEQLSFDFAESDLTSNIDETFLQNELNGFGNGSEILDETLLDEVINISTSEIFSFNKFGNNSLEVGFSGRKTQLVDKVKKLNTNNCIKLEGVVKNNEKANVVEELISILNNVNFQFDDVFTDLKFEKSNNLGERGMKEFLLTSYLSNVSSRILRDFLKDHRKIKVVALYKLINSIIEFEQSVSVKYNKEADDLSDKQLADSEIMGKIATSEYLARKYVRLYSYLNPGCFIEINHKPKSREKLEHSMTNLYLKDLQRRNASISRIDKMKQQVKHHFTFLLNYSDFDGYTINSIPIWRVTREHLIEYKNYLIRQSKLGESTIYTSNRRFKDIKTYYKRLFELQLIKENIGEHLPNIKASDYFYRNLPNDSELEAFFNAIAVYSDNPQKDRLSHALMVLLGFRICELYRLNWEDISLSLKTLVVHSKGRKTHILPIPDALYNLLKSMDSSENRGPVFRRVNEKENTFRCRFVEYFTIFKTLANWNLEGGPHLLRHWYITNLARNNVDLIDIKTLARHDSLVTTSKYIHFYSSELREALDHMKIGGAITWQLQGKN